MTTDANDRPYYTDDPLVDTKAHRLALDRDPIESARAGYDMFRGRCSCGTWATPVYDRHGIFEDFDAHMGQIQSAAHLEDWMNR